MDRRQALIGASLLGAALSSPAMSPHRADPAPLRIPAVVGPHEINAVLADDAFFDRWGHERGSDPGVRRMLASRLHDHSQLLNARCPGTTRTELLNALAQLAHTAAFMAHDNLAHAAADELFDTASDWAQRAGDWHLRASIAANRASAHSWRGRHKDARAYADIALAPAGQLTGTEIARVQTCRARVLAKAGQPQQALAALAHADEAFTPGPEDPSHIRWYDRAEHASAVGQALAELPSTPRNDERAAQHLGTAARLYDTRHPRSATLTRLQLALVQLRLDPRQAAVTAHDALTLTTAHDLHSTRLNDTLRTLNQAADPYRTIPDVAELQHQLSRTLPPT